MVSKSESKAKELTSSKGKEGRKEGREEGRKEGTEREGECERMLIGEAVGRDSRLQQIYTIREGEIEWIAVCCVSGPCLEGHSSYIDIPYPCYKQS